LRVSIEKCNLGQKRFGRSRRVIDLQLALQLLSRVVELLLGEIDLAQSEVRALPGWIFL